MKHQHIQQTRHLPALQDIAGSFLACALSAFGIYILLPAIWRNIKLTIRFPRNEFATYFDLGELVWDMLFGCFIVYVLLQRLATSFQSSLLPVVKLASDKINAGIQEFRVQHEEPKAEQQSTTPRPKRQGNFHQEYQAWREQFGIHIREDSGSDIATHSPAPPIVTSSDTLQAYYSKANLSDEEFHRDRMYWDILAEESKMKYHLFKISMLHGRKEERNI